MLEVYCLKKNKSIREEFPALQIITKCIREKLRKVIFK